MKKRLAFRIVLSVLLLFLIGYTIYFLIDYIKLTNNDKDFLNDLIQYPNPDSSIESRIKNMKLYIIERQITTVVFFISIIVFLFFLILINSKLLYFFIEHRSQSKDSRKQKRIKALESKLDKLKKDK